MIVLSAGRFSLTAVLLTYLIDYCVSCYVYMLWAAAASLLEVYIGSFMLIVRFDLLCGIACACFGY